MKKISSILVMAVFLNIVLLPTSYANPSFSRTEAGNVRIDEQGSVYNIYSADKSIGAFNSFSNVAGETINSIQPSSSNSVLFRVIGAEPSRIFGALNANSRVFLVNASGILFGPGSQVNAPGLVAAAMNISNQDFISKNYRFDSSLTGGGYVLNQGNIDASRGGYVALLGKSVSNEGVINAPEGSVALAAGSRATVSLDAGGLVSVAVNSPIESAVYDFQGNKLDSALSNSGSLNADGGQVILSAQAAEEIFDNAINHSGISEARSVGIKNGKIILSGGDEAVVNVSGTLDASGKNAGEKGGAVKVLGDKVGLFAGTSVDVSGDQGGGTALIGGDYQGKNPDIQNATATYMDPGAAVHANAITAGDGGKIIVWSDASTRVYGSLDARGGVEGGDGGFVETSGHYLDVAGLDLKIGAGGDWLLDPYNVTITAAINAGGSFTGIDPKNWTASAVGSNIQDTAIESLLNGGTNVTISTAGAGVQAGNITQDAAATINFSSSILDVSLTMDAANNIDLQGGVSTAGATKKLSLFLHSNSPVGGTVSGTGGITISAPISTNGGNFASTGVGFNNTGGAINTGSGTFSMIHTGTVTFGGAVTAGGNINVQAAGDINVNAAILAASTTGGNTAGADTSFSPDISMWSTAGSIIGDGSGSLSTATATVNGGAGTDIARSGDINLSASGEIQFAQSDALSTGDAVVSFSDADDEAHVGDINLTGSKVSSDGTNGELELLFGTPSASVLKTAGFLNIATTGGAGDAGGIFITSSGRLDLGDFDTADATSQNITISTTNPSAEISIVGTGPTNLDTDIVELNGAGTIHVTDVVTTLGSLMVTATDDFHLDGTSSITAGGNGTSIDISANTISIANGTAIAPSLKQTGSGSITLTANSGAADNVIELGNYSISIADGTLNLATDVTGSGNYIHLTAPGDSIAEIKASGNVFIDTGATNGGFLELSGDGGGDHLLSVTSNAFDAGNPDLNINVLTDQFNFISMAVFDEQSNINVYLPGVDVIDVNGAVGTSTLNSVILTNTDPDFSFGLYNVADVKVTSITSDAIVDIYSDGKIDATAAPNGTTPDITGSLINLISDAGGIGTANPLELTATLAISADGSDIFLNSIGAMPIGLIDTGGSGNVTLISNGDILSASSDISGDVLTLTAGGADGDIGLSGTHLQTSVSEIHASAAGTGEIAITDSDAVFISNAASSGGPISITSTTGDLSIGTVNAGTGNVNLTATGGDLISSASLITGSTLTLLAGGADGDVGVNATRLNTIAGNIFATATGTGEVGIHESDGVVLSNITTAGGDVNINSTTGNLGVGIVNAVGGNVVLDATAGDILSASSNITGNLLTLTSGGADGDIGVNGTPLRTNVANISATATGTGEIAITESNGALLSNIQTAGGNIKLVSSLGNLSIGTVNASTGNVWLEAQNGDLVDATSIISGNLLTLNAGGSDGDVGVNAANLNTSATDIVANAHGTGEIAIDEANAVTLSHVQSSGGDIRVSVAAGNMDVTLVDATSLGDVYLTTSAGEIYDAQADGVAPDTAPPNVVGQNITFSTLSGDVGTAPNPIEILFPATILGPIQYFKFVSAPPPPSNTEPGIIIGPDGELHLAPIILKDINTVSNPDSLPPPNEEEDQKDGDSPEAFTPENVTQQPEAQMDEPPASSQPEPVQQAAFKPCGV